MSSLKPTRAVTAHERDELTAQRIACTHLVKGCERALFHLALSSSDTGSDEETLLDQRAAGILREILGSWRATLNILRRLESKQSWPDVETLEGWLQIDPQSQDSRFALEA